MADWGGLTECQLNQSLRPKVPTIAAPYRSMGYAAEFQLIEQCQAKENAAPTAMGNGAKLDAKHDISLKDHATGKPRTAMSKYAPDRHKRAARMLGYCLTLDTIDAWWCFAAVIDARLTVKERTALAFMALSSLDTDEATQVAQARLGDGAGQPIPPLFDHMDEAAFWADLVFPDELEAYCLAAFNRMAPKLQAAFLDHVQARAAA